MIGLTSVEQHWTLVSLGHPHVFLWKNVCVASALWAVLLPAKLTVQLQTKVFGSVCSFQGMTTDSRHGVNSIWSILNCIIHIKSFIDIIFLLYQTYKALFLSFINIWWIKYFLES